MDVYSLVSCFYCCYLLLNILQYLIWSRFSYNQGALVLRKCTILVDMVNHKRTVFLEGDGMYRIYHFLKLYTAQFRGGGQVDVVYTDFEKAFDRVDHDTLLRKLCGRTS